jgi:methyl-accepting chemotaxis protein
MTEKKIGIHSLKYMIMLIVGALVIAIALIYGVFSAEETQKLSDTSVEKYEAAMESGYRTEIKSQVQSAIALLQGYYDQYKNGDFDSEEAAQNAAKEAIRSMRYRDDGSGYMWIDSTDYTLVMHPILPEQEGDNRKELEDQNGVMIIQEIMKAADDGGGYNSFYFTKADGKTVAPKLAYSEKFEPWNWVVTTGNYVDDMQKEMQTTESGLTKSFHSMMMQLALVSVLLLIAAAVIAVFAGRRIAAPIEAMKQALEQIADGNLRFDIDRKYLNRKDEIGKIAAALERVRSSLNGMVGGINSLAKQLQQDNQNFSNHFSKAAENMGSINIAVEEIAEGATNQATDTEVVNGKVRDLERVIDKEKDAVTRLEQAISSMMEYSGSAVKNIEQLSEISEKTNHAITFVNEQTQKTNHSVGDIQQAIGVITSIAEQTSLLSLNASIEAARAGEQGKGFAVVAEEIRKLADESNQSASEIGEAVGQLITNSEMSVDKMQDVSQNVQEQMKRLEETRSAFESLYKEIQSVEEVSENLGVQTGQLAELKTTVADSVNSLASVIEQSAASAQETSASMSVLNENIEGSRENLEKLILLNDDLTSEIGKFSV